MTEPGIFSQLINRLAYLFSFGRRNQFTCGDCTMNERCGLPPSDKCVARAAQIASGRSKPRVTNLSAPY